MFNEINTLYVHIWQLFIGCQKKLIIGYFCLKQISLLNLNAFFSLRKKLKLSEDSIFSEYNTHYFFQTELTGVWKIENVSEEQKRDVMAFAGSCRFKWIISQLTISRCMSSVNSGSVSWTRLLAKSRRIFYKLFFRYTDLKETSKW